MPHPANDRAKLVQMHAEGLKRAIEARERNEQMAYYWSEVEKGHMDELKMLENTKETLRLKVPVDDV